mgnify:FL=1|tara:strand:+ start:711 stop:1124 length:414 start_codon:yes stop_codon:yes gene_type:complete
MTDVFTDPSTATGDQWKPKTHLGRLVMFTVDRMSEEITTDFGPATPIICSQIVVLDGEDPGAVFDDAFVFGAGMIPQLKPSAGGGKVLGRIGQREAKPGKSGAWFIDVPTDADKDLARQWIAAKAQPVAAPAGNPFD